MSNPLLPSATDENLSFFQRHPIFKQALDDASHLTWQQIGLPSLAAMGNLTISLYNDYHANHLDLSASVKTFLYSLLIGAVLYILVAIARAPFIVMGRHHHQIDNLNQRVMEVENRPLPVPALSAPATPNLKLRMASILGVKTEISDRVFGAGDQLLKEQGEQSPRGSKAAVLEFVNEPLAGSVAEIKAAKAILTYHEIDGERRSLDVDSGVWLGLDKSYVSFDIGHSEKLVVAVQLSETGRQPTTYEYHRKPEADGGLLTNLAPIQRDLKGAAYRIKVQIVNRAGTRATPGEGELIGEYFFRLTTSPLGLVVDNVAS